MVIKMTKKKLPSQKSEGPGFNFSKENDRYIDELMVENPDRIFYPKYVYNLACLACILLLISSTELPEFFDINSINCS